MHIQLTINIKPLNTGHFSSAEFAHYSEAKSYKYKCLQLKKCLLNKGVYNSEMSAMEVLLHSVLHILLKLIHCSCYSGNLLQDQFSIITQELYIKKFNTFVLYNLHSVDYKEPKFHRCETHQKACRNFELYRYGIENISTYLLFITL